MLIRLLNLPAPKLHVLHGANSSDLQTCIMGFVTVPILLMKKFKCKEVYFPC